MREDSQQRTKLYNLVSQSYLLFQQIISGFSPPCEPGSVFGIGLRGRMLLPLRFAVVLALALSSGRDKEFVVSAFRIRSDTKNGGETLKMLASVR